LRTRSDAKLENHKNYQEKEGKHLEQLERVALHDKQRPL
jgi:hypothetical protein